ncbi:hypothetical protein GQ607_009206 [Colletotrichum asianum]|uniref:Uncharacterized protein n=1 Tax=Colletotrichum asianum TaxID=702518 RepID=A0A8H3WC81_9PEZI|nr:hypothetical protein GQ607_009206 [Colletotrichum asianum]
MPIRQAINAQFIMNDDLPRVDGLTHGDTLPEFFWWPHCPHEDTLREFAWRRPDMKHQIALACIVGQYQHLFDELKADLEPTQDLLEVAYQCPDEHYRKQVNRCAEARGVELYSMREVNGKYLRPCKEMYRGFSSVHFPKELINRPDQHDEDWEEWSHPVGKLFNYHMHYQFADWQIFISAMDDARESLGNTYGCLYYLSADDLRRRSKPGPAPPFPKKFESDEDDAHRDEEHFGKKCAIPSWKLIA